VPAHVSVPCSPSSVLQAMVLVPIGVAIVAVLFAPPTAMVVVRDVFSGIVSPAVHLFELLEGSVRVAGRVAYAYVYPAVLRGLCLLQAEVTALATTPISSVVHLLFSAARLAIGLVLSSGALMLGAARKLYQCIWLFKWLSDAVSNYLGSLTLLALFIWYTVRLADLSHLRGWSACSASAREEVITRVCALADVRLPVFVAAWLGAFHCSFAWVVVIVCWAHNMLSASRARAVRKSKSVAYQLPMLGPQGIKQLYSDILNPPTCSPPLPSSHLRQRPVMHQAAIPTMGGVPHPRCAHASVDKHSAATAQPATAAVFRGDRTDQVHGVAQGQGEGRKQQAVRCGACEWTGRLEELVSSHSLVCPKKPVQCVMAACPWRGTQQDLPQHLLAPAPEWQRWHAHEGGGGIAWLEPLREVMTAVSGGLQALPVVGATLSLTLSPVIAGALRFLGKPQCAQEGGGTLEGRSGSLRGGGVGSRAEAVQLGEGLVGGVLMQDAASLHGPLAFWERLVGEVEREGAGEGEGGMGGVARRLPALVVRYADKIHLVLGAGVAYLCARCGFVSAAVPIAYAVVQV
jgi:hypothetical protein